MRKIALALVSALAAATLVTGAPHAADAAPRKKAPETVLMIGDSTTYRVEPKLNERHPTWTIDGQSGRPIRALPNRIEQYLKDNPAPDHFIMALGTNHSVDPDWTKERLERAIAKFPASTNVYLMMVVRCGDFQAFKDADLKLYNSYSRELVKERPNTQIINWRGTVLADPTLNAKTGISSLLEDGTHQTGSPNGRGGETPGPGVDTYVRLIESKVTVD